MNPKTRSIIIKTLLLVFVSLSTMAASLPQERKSETGNGNVASPDVHLLVVSRNKNCNPDKVRDPNAPCYAAVFSDSVMADYGVYSVQSTYTCGVEVKNALNVVVARLWENVSVTWLTNGYTINGATKNTWVANSLYGWTNLSGPAPSSGTYTGSYNMRSVITRGSVTYFGGIWHTFEVRLTLNGNQSNPSASCQIY